MSKPWEENWAHEPSDRELPISLLDAGDWNYAFGSTDKTLPHAVTPEHHAARCQLASAAPDMARALLAIDDALSDLKSRIDSFGASEVDQSAIDAEKLIDAALRKAGVR